MPTGQTLIHQIDQIAILPGSLAIWGLGQMGFVIKGADGILYVDPCLSYQIEARAYPPPILPADVRHADYVLCSHEHIDHFDVDTLDGLLCASPQARVITTRWCEPLAQQIGLASERLLYPPVHEAFTLPNTTCQIMPVPSAHPTLEYHAEKGHRWLGFIIIWNGVTVYFAGDTVIYDGYVEMLQRAPQADIAILPVNGRDAFRDAKDIVGNLHPREASKLALALGWELIIAGHNDLFAENTVPMGEIAQAFADDAPRQAYKIMQPGELLYYVKA